VKRGAASSAAAAGGNNNKTDEDDDDLKALLAKHNKKFRSHAPAYVPSLSVKETKKWEAETGRVYRSLNMSEREQANNEIKAWKLEEAKGKGGR
jgi:hypothetical protein